MYLIHTMRFVCLSIIMFASSASSESVLKSPVPEPITSVKKLRSEPSNKPFYASISGGMTDFLDANIGNSGSSDEFSFETGYSFSAAMGYQPNQKRGFLRHVRSELSFHYATSNLDDDGTGSGSSSGDINTMSLMLNAYYDLHNHSMFTPYIGGGLGVMRAQVNDINQLSIDDEADETMAYQLMIGTSLQPNLIDDTSLHLGYRYVSAFGDFSVSDSSGNKIEIEHDAHHIEGGIRFNF